MVQNIGVAGQPSIQAFASRGGRRGLDNQAQHFVIGVAHGRKLQ